MRGPEFSYSPNSGPGAERRIPIWQRSIEIEDIISDNESPEAQRRRESSLQSLESNDETVVARCADARYQLTWERITTIPTVATGKPSARYKGRFQQNHVPGIIELPHLNCGGLTVRGNQEIHGVAENAPDSHRFVAEYVPESDPGRQALRSAREDSLLVEKPVLAAVHNHDNGDIYTLAVYRNGKPDYSRELIGSFQRFFRQ
jgi:hypothetical protein